MEGALIPHPGPEKRKEELYTGSERWVSEGPSPASEPSLSFMIVTFRSDHQPQARLEPLDWAGMLLRPSMPKSIPDFHR